MLFECRTEDTAVGVFEPMWVQNSGAWFRSGCMHGVFPHPRFGRKCEETMMCLLSKRIATRRDPAMAAQIRARPFVYQVLLCSGTCGLVAMTSA